MDKIRKLKSAVRSLPHSETAEQSILSTMLQDTDGIVVNKSIELGITEETFHIPAHRKIFSLLYKLVNKGTKIELVSFTQTIQDLDELINIGGPAYITTVYTFSPTNAHFDHHLKIVLEKFQLREIISKSTEAIEKAYITEDVGEFIDETEKEIFSIRRDSSQSRIEDSDDLLKKALLDLEQFITGDKELEGLPTRFKTFNDLTRGLKRGEMSVLAARPSMGKTSLMCNIITDLTIWDIPGIVFSCEMTADELMKRILYGKAKFAMHYLKKGFLPTKDELRRISQASQEIYNKNLKIDDTPAIKIDALRAKLRRLKKETDIKYFAVDYLQLMTGSKSYEGREKEIAEISSGLKAIAKELDIHALILAQLNRNAEKRQQGIPRMGDLRESGATEQDADIVGLLYRPDYYGDEQEDESNANRNSKEQGGDKKRKLSALLIIAKNRNGPTGDVEMTWEKEIMQFT